MPTTRRKAPLGATDVSKWRLDSQDEGRHVWHYAADPSRSSTSSEQTDEEKYWLGLPLNDLTYSSAGSSSADSSRPATPLEAARKGFEFYKKLQSEDGHWAGEYGGPLFLLPGIVFAMYISQTPIPQEWKIEMARYLTNMRRDNGEGDEGWGLHIEGVSTVMGTSLNYVVLRILGVGPDEPMMVKARSTLLFHGGAAAAPSWAKLWLATLNLYSWEGTHPIPPELWLLPTWFPMSPTKWWSYNRMVVLPMTFLSGSRFATPLNPLLRSLREELYADAYDSINWPSQRSNIASVDLYSPHPALLEVVFAVSGAYERVHSTWLRKRALDYVYELIKMEDENTSYQCQAPVNKALNMICRWIREGPSSDAFRLHKAKIRDFMWMSKDGMMTTGTNGSQLWDAGFIAQALYESGLATEDQNKESTTKLLSWIDRCQIRENPRWFGEMSRHASKGAWPFSTREQGYTISDCTSEGLKAVIYLQSLPDMPQLVSRERMCDAVDIILSLQNADGGFAACELVRGSTLLEMLNPAEVFRDIMIEHTYPECTTACLTALSVFSKLHPDYRPEDIERTSARAISFIHSSQRPDGSWYGSWAVCFTYATMFALESLALVGETAATSSRAAKACEFLLSKQIEDGGWGESFQCCETREYVQHEQSQVVNTAYAIIGLLAAKSTDHEAIRRGCRLLMQRQLDNGEWAQEAIEGVFNHTCGISYPNYKFYWSIWALGKAQKELGDEGW
ncbi:terpenoid cyclases/protein prenyltransferase alpha-alpha toroid [Leucosporidium creatinivorum]|uniref:Terpene cyclase/mutase family member n=1 Tax=Leucosporidium creatinivorum TaxID=106004 RepID=A0A1Y2ED30_9BASI|nr:terpenoid cyclases/protein prenyltransferase alpha-alpha toroid [Leucosporidium creatinivorum]